MADGIGEAKDWLLAVPKVGVAGNGVGPEGPGDPDVFGMMVLWDGRGPLEADLGVWVSPGLVCPDLVPLVGLPGRCDVGLPTGGGSWLPLAWDTVSLAGGGSWLPLAWDTVSLTGGGSWLPLAWDMVSLAPEEDAELVAPMS